MSASTAAVSLALATPPASAADAHQHFAARLRFETDVADVAADIAAGTVPYAIIDVRAAEHYARGHVPGAVNLPLARLDRAVATRLPNGPLVIYCWGPGCNGAHRAAYRLTRFGRQVKEMIGGFEYWAREGQPIDGTDARQLERLSQPELVG
jgi:rhodanese-related sulfurtransferase